jgi:Ca-activated chloride channel family protein
MSGFGFRPGGSACILTLLLASTALTSAPPAFAAVEDSIHDGTPSAAACANLGFAPARDDEDTNTPQKLQRQGGVFNNFRSVAPMMEALPSPPPAAATGKAIGSPMPTVAMPDVNTEKYPNATSNPIKSVDRDPVSTFSIDVDTASYANVRSFLRDGTLPPRDAVRVEELLNYFDYGYALPSSRETPFATTVAVAPSPWAAGKQVIHIGLQGYDLPGEKPPLNLVFLVDVSGSMDEKDKLPLVQKSLNVLIDQLRPQDRVSMVVYAGAAGAVLGPTAGNEHLKMRCAVEVLHAGGSTAGGEGLALAYDLAQQNFDAKAVNRVILMTDGDFNVGVADPEKLEDLVAEKRKTGIYLSALGFGHGNYNDLMMQTLSQSGNGIAGYIDTLDEAKKVFREDFSSSLFPIADDVKIQVEFNPAMVSEYRLVGYETRMLDRSDFNNDRVDAGDVGSAASVTALYEVTPVGGPIASDPLRYQKVSETVVPARDGELAYIKIRYKLPGQPNSRLIERPVTVADGFASVDAAPEATRWALAVAGFGQELRGDPWIQTGGDWQAIAALARGARGEDPYGLRGEFLQLVGDAETARPLGQ